VDLVDAHARVGAKGGQLPVGRSSVISQTLGCSSASPSVFAYRP
jgi:hypothetical protein